MTIGTLTAAVIAAFAVEHTAQSNTDSALRDLFVGFAQHDGTASQALRESKDAAQGLNSAERKARCIPASASQVTGAWFVGSIITECDDDTFCSGWVRDAWDMASAIANEAKYGGGRFALTGLLEKAEDDVLTVSEVLVRLGRLDSSVKAARRRALAKPKPVKVVPPQDPEQDPQEPSSDSESALSLSDRLAALVGPVNAVRDMMATVEASDADKAQAQALIDALSAVLSPDTVITIPSTVESLVGEPIDA